MAERSKLHLKGGEPPGVHFELVDMFLECGHFSQFAAPTSCWCEGGVKGEIIRAWTPNYLEAISGFHRRAYLQNSSPGLPLPSLLQHHFLFLEPDASSREQKKGAPGTPQFCPNFGLRASGVDWDPREAPRGGGHDRRPPLGPSGRKSCPL